MTKRKKSILTGVLGFASLLASAAAFVLVQVCFVESFWLHAVVAPMNPHTLFQPTFLKGVGALCQLLIVPMLLAGVALLATSGWQLFRRQRTPILSPDPAR